MYNKLSVITNKTIITLYKNRKLMNKKQKYVLMYLNVKIIVESRIHNKLAQYFLAI